MMPTPILFKDERSDFMPHLRPELRSTKLPAFYATSRKPVSPDESGHYADAKGDGVRLGMAVVRLGVPDWTWDDLVASDRTSTIEKPRPAGVESVREFGAFRGQGQLSEEEQDFVVAINARLAMTRSQDVVLYVHGYRVTFNEVSVLMGSFAHYLGQSVTISFQWETGLHFWNYVTDCPSAEQYIPDIERLIALVSHTQAEHINLVAYSCGSPLLAQALVKLRSRHPEEGQEQLRQRYRIGNAIFAGSDIDLKAFAEEQFDPIMDLAKQVIAYVSKQDAALAFSAMVAGASRLGHPDADDLTREDLARLAADPRFEVVDVTNVRGAHEMGGMKGHGYWFANEWISTDVLLSMRYPIPAKARCLTPTSYKNIWQLSDDYPDCLVDRVVEAYPELRRSPPQ
jgi:esterase/lipase superfamily enzyme